MKALLQRARLKRAIAITGRLLVVFALALLVLRICKFFWAASPLNQCKPTARSAYVPGASGRFDAPPAYASRAARAALSPSSCVSNLKVYVYNVPRKFTTALLDVQVANVARTPVSVLQSTLHDGGTEALFHKYLLLNRTGVLTYDPDEADLFFVPFYASASTQSVGLAQRGLLRELRERHLTYWRNCNGCDHVFALGRHYSQRTGYGISSNALTKGTSSILLLFEVTNAPQRELQRTPWSFSRNIIIPWPRLLPTSYSTAALRSSASNKRPNEFAFVASGINSARRSLATALKQWSESAAHVSLVCGNERKNMQRSLTSDVNTSAWFHDGAGIISTDKMRLSDVYAQSDFCFCPRGDSRSDTRFFDAARSLCIPVIVNNQLRMLPFERSIQYEAFTLFAEVHTNADATLLLQRLHAIPLAQRVRMREAMSQHVSKLTYEEAEHPNAFDAAMHELSARASVLSQAKRVLAKADEQKPLLCKLHTALC